jgi:hypothetical protein
MWYTDSSEMLLVALYEVRLFHNPKYRNIDILFLSFSSFTQLDTPGLLSKIASVR